MHTPSQIVESINRKIMESYPAGVVTIGLDADNKIIYVYKHTAYKVSKMLFKEARDNGFQIKYQNVGKISMF